VPSFWSRADVTQAFADANRIWIREAEIEFTPVEISERTEVVPADENGMWIHFVNNHLHELGASAVGFVYDLPSHEGGGEEDVSRQSRVKSRVGFCRVLPEPTGTRTRHVLMDDPNHSLALNVTSNLMYGARNPRVANAGLLNEQQINIARNRALRI